MKTTIAVVLLLMLCACASEPEPCSVKQGEDGSATITCPDGSTAEVSGPKGDQGEPGDAGALLPVLLLRDKDGEVVPAQVRATPYDRVNGWDVDPLGRLTSPLDECVVVMGHKGLNMPMNYGIDLKTGKLDERCIDFPRDKVIYPDSQCSGMPMGIGTTDLVEHIVWHDGKPLIPTGERKEVVQLHKIDSRDECFTPETNGNPLEVNVLGPIEGSPRAEYLLYLDNPPYTLTVEYIGDKKAEQ